MTVQWVSFKTNICEPLLIKYSPLMSHRGVRKGCVCFHGKHNLIFPVLPREALLRGITLVNLLKSSV